MHYRVARSINPGADHAACGALDYQLADLGEITRREVLTAQTTKDVGAVTCRRCKKSDAYRRALTYAHKGE